MCDFKVTAPGGAGGYNILNCTDNWNEYILIIIWNFWEYQQHQKSVALLLTDQDPRLGSALVWWSFISESQRWPSNLSEHRQPSKHSIGCDIVKWQKRRYCLSFLRLRETDETDLMGVEKNIRWYKSFNSNDHVENSETEYHDMHVP